MLSNKSELTNWQKERGLLFTFLVSMTLGLCIAMGAYKYSNNKLMEASGVLFGAILLPVGAIHLYSNKYLR